MITQFFAFRQNIVKNEYVYNFATVNILVHIILPKKEQNCINIPGDLKNVTRHDTLLENNLVAN